MRIASNAASKKPLLNPDGYSAEKAEARVGHRVSEAERRIIEEQAEAAMRAWNDYERRYGSVADEFGEL
jgi:hypothetical protein